MDERFPLHDPATAPASAAPMLRQTEGAFGMIPNLERAMASAPALLAAYGTLWDQFDETSFDPRERQVVYQTVNVEHGCDY